VSDGSLPRITAFARGAAGAALGALLAFGVAPDMAVSPVRFALAVLSAAAIVAWLSVRLGDPLWAWLAARLRWLA
jgi:hypothetical protein